MAIYHCSVKVIGRSSGRSSVASSAYRSGEDLTNERDGIRHNYTQKKGIEHTEILAPKHAPEWATDRGKLWNEVERVEKSKKAQLSREVEIALPSELSKEKQVELVREYAKENFVDKGMVADICLHDKMDGNPHAHIMLTMRPFEKDGSWGEKQKKEYILDKNGNRQYDAEKKTYKCKTIKTTDWDNTETLEKWRMKWEEVANKYLEREGHEQRIDHRSYKEQGIEKVPQIHEGPIVREMEKRGIETDKGNTNREIAKENCRLELYERQENNLAEERKIEQAVKPEPQKETLSFNHEKVKVSELLKDAWEYRKSLEQIDTEKAKQLGEWKQRKNDIAQPYRAEAIEKHIQERWGAEWTKVQKEKRWIAQKMRDHADGKGYGMFDRLSGVYKRDGEELRNQSRNIDFREKDLISVFERTRQELINPRNINAHGRYEVDKMADRIAQERDPQYKNKREVISRIEEKIIADRQSLLSERKLAQSLCHNLEKVRNRNQEIELDLPRDQTGERLSITKAMEIPQIKEKMKQLMGKVSQSLKPHQKSLERDRGGMER